MTTNEAKRVAKKIREHSAKRKQYRGEGNRDLEKYHEGCMKMAMQIFEEFNLSHGFGSPEHALGLTSEQFQS